MQQSRLNAEAFLAKKVVVCEGATEVGFVRGFDDHQIEQGKDALSYHGVELLDAKGGAKIKALAKALKSLCYDVSVLADADAPDQFSPADEAELIELGIPVVVWGDKQSLEERAIQDLPWNAIQASLKLAQSEFSVPVRDHVLARLTDKLELDKNTDNWVDSANLRKAIGIAAKKSEWFKSVSKGDLWFKAIAPAYKTAEFAKKDLAVKLNKFWTWVEHV